MFRFIWLFLRAGNPVLRYGRVHRGWFLGALASIGVYLGACVLALYMNILGIQELNFLFAGVFQLIAFLILFMPGNSIAVAILGFLGGQPGNDPGLSVEDGIRGAKEYMAQFARVAGSIIFYGSIPFLLLGIFSFEGHAYGAIIMLSLAAPVAIGAGRIFHNSTFFIKLVYWVEVIVLVATLGLTLRNTYWRYVGNGQDVLVNQIEEALQKKIAENEQTRLKAILEKVKKGKPLEKNDPEFLNKMRLDRDKKSPGGFLSSAGTVVNEGVSNMRGTFVKARHGEEHPVLVEFSKERPWEPLEVCGLPIGSYRISVRDTIAAPITDADGRDKGVFNLATPELKLGSQFGITVDGKHIGETLGVTTQGQCLRISAAMFPETRAAFARGGYQLGSAPSTTLVLTR